MQKKITVLLMNLLIILLIPVSGWPAMENISVTGAVKQSLSLTPADLRKYDAATVRINDIKKDGTFHGVFTTRGVSLRSLLDVASIQKTDTGYSKPIDLAIVASNKEGKKVALSWGELFYGNPADVILAYSSTPVLPHHECNGCHEQAFYKPYMDQLNRAITFPKLVVANDFDSDRSLEGIVGIEVVNLFPKTKDDKKNTGLSSSRITITGAVNKTLTIKSLSHLPRTSVTMNIVGDGRGFHGRKEYSGAPLAELLVKAGIKTDLRSVFVVSAPDGYRSLFSYGELFLSPRGKRIIIADRENSKAIEKNGKFMLIAPDDLAADREVKAVEKIEVYTLGQPSK